MLYDAYWWEIVLGDVLDVVEHCCHVITISSVCFQCLFMVCIADVDIVSCLSVCDIVS